jgi:hypothetical protein
MAVLAGIPPAQMRNLVDEAEHRVADRQRLLGVGLEVDTLDLAHATDLIGRVLRDQADFGLGAGKRRLPVEIFLGAELVRPDLAHGGRAENIAEDQTVDGAGGHRNCFRCVLGERPRTAG